MKKLLVFILSSSIFLVSCTNLNEGKIIKKLQKTLDKYDGYMSEVEMKTIMDNKESLYKMKESYTNEDKYKLEITEPEDSRGIIIQYDDDKIFLKHASIGQSISLNNVKTFNKGLLVGEFFRDLASINSIEEEEIDGEKYYVFYNNVENKNKFTEKILIWLKKKDFKPYMLNILDEDNNPRVIIRHTNFEFTKD